MTYKPPPHHCDTGTTASHHHHFLRPLTSINSRQQTANRVAAKLRASSMSSKVSTFLAPFLLFQVLFSLSFSGSTTRMPELKQTDDATLAPCTPTTSPLPLPRSKLETEMTPPHHNCLPPSTDDNNDRAIQPGVGGG